MSYGLILIAIGALIVVGVTVAAMSRYKTVPADKILVISGWVGGGKTIHCQHSGARFIWPLIQEYAFLPLRPMQIDIKLEGALSKQNIRINIPSRFTIGVSTEPNVMGAAAERLLSMSLEEIKENAEEIIFGQLRATIATMDIESINADRESFEQKVMDNVEGELRKIGLRLINVNIKDIEDENGYIEALGKKATAEAINRAKIEVAVQNKTGAIGEASAMREQRIEVADADAKAILGENQAKINIANSDSDRDVSMAEAKKRSEAAKQVQAAKAQEETYLAEKEAELKRAERAEAELKADIVVPSEIEKKKVVIQAEADAEKVKIAAAADAERVKIAAAADAEKVKIAADANAFSLAAEGRGHGEKIRQELIGRAEGVQALLTKQAEGLRSIVEAAGGDAEKAAMLMITDKLPELVKIQVEAIKNLKIDKVTVWDNGGGKGGEKSSTANFLSGLMGSVPPLQELFGMAGMDLPKYLGEAKKKESESEDPA